MTTEAGTTQYLYWLSQDTGWRGGFVTPIASAERRIEHLVGPKVLADWQTLVMEVPPTTPFRSGGVTVMFKHTELRATYYINDLPYVHRDVRGISIGDIGDPIYPALARPISPQEAVNISYTGDSRLWFHNGTMPEYGAGGGVLEVHLSPVSYTKSVMKIRAKRCPSTGCIVFLPCIPATTAFWSNSTWGRESRPKEGEDVNIPCGMTLIVDVETPHMHLVRLQGTMMFSPSVGGHLHADQILNLGGELRMGTEAEPFPSTQTARITLHGLYGQNSLGIDNEHDVGTAVLVNLGAVSIFGAPQPLPKTVLKRTSEVNATSVLVAGDASHWPVGAHIAIATSEWDFRETEEAALVSVSVYQDNEGDTVSMLQLNTTLQYRHFAGWRTVGDQARFIASQVALLSRNVIIEGDGNAEG